jgi:enamine deaminase RidA (YjgF/YER057c/UK114 family)
LELEVRVHEHPSFTELPLLSASVRMSPMGERKAIEPAVWGEELRWYRETRLSPAVQVGDLLFVAGCTGASGIKDGPRAEMRRAYEEIGEVLAAAGASWDDVVSMNTYHVDFRRDIDAMVEIHREFVSKEPFPAWTAVGVTQLYEPDAVVEIAVTAVLPRSLEGSANERRRPSHRS